MGGSCTRRPSVVESNNLIENKIEILLNTSPKDKTESLKTSDDYFFCTNYNLQIIENNNNSFLNHRSYTPSYYNISQHLEFIKGECIGIGKLGSVHSGLSTNSGEIVAIKSIKLNKNKSIQKQIYEVNETVEKLSELNHKNIIKYICTQPSDNVDEIDLIFEYCNGGSIKQLLEKFGQFDEKLIKLYVKQILQGLSYLHEENIVHRNIKNCNVLVDGNGIVKLSDFVISDIIVGDDPNAILCFHTDNGKDPPYFMPPEIINKIKYLTNSIDIWSLGCIIVEMATNIPPWSNITNDCNEVIKLIGNSNAPPKFPHHVSKELKSFLFLCLQKNPENRPSAKKLLDHNFFKNNLNLPISPIIKNLDQISENNNSSKFKDLNKLKDLQNNIKIDNGMKLLKINSKSVDKKINLDPPNTNSENKIKIIDEANKCTLTAALNKNKLIKNKKIYILENKIEEKNEDNNNLGNKNNVNILAEETQGGVGLFTVSMTISSQQSLLPQLIDHFNNKENKILPTNITEEEDNNYSPQNNKNNFNFENLFLENGANLDLDKTNMSIKQILENYNLNSNLDFINLEKLGTLELKKEEMQKLEIYFKERNNKVSIGPIERDRMEHFIKEMKIN